MNGSEGVSFSVSCRGRHSPANGLPSDMSLWESSVESRFRSTAAQLQRRVTEMLHTPRLLHRHLCFGGTKKEYRGRTFSKQINKSKDWNFIFFGVIKTDFFFSIVTDFRNKLTIDTFVLVFFTLWRFSPFRQLSCTVRTVVLFVRPVLHGNKHALYPSRSWKPSTRPQSFYLLITILIVFETALNNQWNITTKKTLNTPRLDFWKKKDAKKHHAYWLKDMKRFEHERNMDYSGYNDHLVMDATLHVNVMYSTCTGMDSCHAVGRHS